MITECLDFIGTHSEKVSSKVKDFAAHDEVYADVISRLLDTE